MVRIFASLYLFIAISLVVLSAGLEQAFFSHSNSEDTTIVAVSEMLSGLPRDSDSLTEVTGAMGLAPTVIAMDAISWSAQEQQALKQGRVIPLFSGDEMTQFYLVTNEMTLLELTLHHAVVLDFPLWLYSLVFFILLGIALAIWVWPLWRDLSKLKSTSEQLLPDGSLPRLNLASASPVRPIGDAMNNLSEQVKSLLNTQRELTGAVAHEIRTPLSRLKFAMAMKPSPDSTPWFAMQRDLEELERRVQEMLNYTSTDAQEPELNYSEIPLYALSEHLISEVNRHTPEQLTIQLKHTDVIVLADEHYLSRAIENLLYNAIRYARERIQVRAITCDAYIDIWVEDDGEGVPVELTEKVFEPFFRPDDSRDRKRGGAGLGLAIVKRIMLWHRGSCWVEASESGGARFVLRLPRQTLNS